MNSEQSGPPWGMMHWILGAMIWIPLLYFLVHFSFLSRGAKRAAWQANLGMFCGFLGLLVLPALLAIPLGHWARRRIKRSEGQLTGRGRAAFALFVGYGLTACLVGLIGLAVSQQLELRSGLAAIDRAKATWSVASGANAGVTPTKEDLAPFMEGGAFPRKISMYFNEEYEINPIGVKASHPLLWLKRVDKAPAVGNAAAIPVAQN